MKQGFKLETFSLPPELRNSVEKDDWNSVDATFHKLTASDGELFKFLRQYHEFQAIEFIISIRDSQNDWEEDGIWHDDGSRVFAFSLSLSVDHENIEGGKLGLRKKGEESFTEIPTPAYGDIILFLTGIHGFEHKIHRVTKGRRVIIAGWCS